MSEESQNFKILLCKLELNPSKGVLRQSCDVEYVNLEQVINSARKALKVREELLDQAVSLLYVFWVVNDEELALHLKLDTKQTRQAMLFIAVQLREQVTLLQDNARGWIMRLRWTFEGVGGS